MTTTNMCSNFGGKWGSHPLVQLNGAAMQMIRNHFSKFLTRSEIDGPTHEVSKWQKCYAGNDMLKLATAMEALAAYSSQIFQALMKGGWSNGLALLLLRQGASKIPHVRIYQGDNIGRKAKSQKSNPPRLSHRIRIMLPPEPPLLC